MPEADYSFVMLSSLRIFIWSPTRKFQINGGGLLNRGLEKILKCNKRTSQDKRGVGI